MDEFMYEYAMFMHEFWKELAESDYLSFRDALLYSFIFTSGFYYSFKKLFEMFNRKAKRRRTTFISQTIRCTWSICFFLAMILFLWLYHAQFISPEFERETRQLFPKFSNSLFFKVCDMTKFKLVTLILTSFYFFESLIDLNERNFAESTNKIMFACVLLVCYSVKLENYSVLLNIYVGFYNIVVHITHFIALNINARCKMFLRFLVILRLLTWIFIYLNILPFDFLIPSMNSRKTSFQLNLLVWAWYVVGVWNSPFLKYFYHQTYHTNYDCRGGKSVFRCILLEDSPDQRHLRYMKRICLEVKARKVQKKLEKVLKSEQTSSAKTFQTIKCIMTLKRKLKRIRAREKAIQDSSNLDDTPDEDESDDRSE